jgi:hypothetical protein
MVCRGWPASGFSHVASNIRVAGGKKNTFGQKVSEQLADCTLFPVRSQYNPSIREVIAGRQETREASKPHVKNLAS